MHPTRLQLGSSRLELLPEAALACFLDKTWIHYGDAPGEVSGLRRAVRRWREARRGIHDVAALYAKTNFAPFHYRKGDKLSFEDASLHFVFSEHFFEHLFFDDALALLRECHRVLASNGVVRISVPDADLRPDPEPVGYPDKRMPFSDPTKHKTRWSFYMLSDALRLTGFEPVALRYWSRDGKQITNTPRVYEGCPEPLVGNLGYLVRPDSLIVDGIKR
jgi:SAM-dependent methyltransferase